MEAIYNKGVHEMVKHVILWQLKDSLTEEEKKQVKLDDIDINVPTKYLSNERK